MRPLCSFAVRLSIHSLLLIGSTIAAIGCVDTTVPIVPTHYLVTTSKSTAGAGDTLVVTAQLADDNDRNVSTAGKLVSWFLLNANGKFVLAQSNTNEQGLASNFFIVGPKAGVADEIFVSDEDQLQGRCPPITVVAGPPSMYVVTTTTSSAVVGATIPIFAQLADQYGNPARVAGRVVTWSLADNDGYYYQRGVRATRVVIPNRASRLRAVGGTFASSTSTTNDQGIASVDFDVGTSVNTTYIVAAVDEQHAAGNSALIFVHPGPVTSFVVNAAVTDPPAGATVLITASASDAYGNAITAPGMEVHWSLIGVGGSLSSAISTADQNGIAVTSLTTSGIPGSTYSVTASSAQSTASGTSPTITSLEQMSLASMATAFGSESSCGIATDGKVWCWGTEDIRPSRPVPGKPVGDQRLSNMSTGAHSCGISAGTVICWGQDSYGQLGDDSRTNRTTPAPISSSLSFTAVSTGSVHTCGLASTGTIYCWGFPGDGRLGDGTGYGGLSPIKVAGSVTFTAVSAGRAHTCAIATSGDAYCWGANDQGQLGIGSLNASPTPAIVSGGLKFTAISAGDSHTCGITASGAYCWGNDSFGELGDGSGALYIAVPSAVRNSSTFVAIAVGGFDACAIASDGKAYCWGDNSRGEVGNPQFAQTHAGIPVPVAGDLTFKSIAVGGSGQIGGDYYGASVPPSGSGHACAVTTDAIAYCWGDNSQGELGTTSVKGYTANPVKVDGQH